MQDYVISKKFYSMHLDTAYEIFRQMKEKFEKVGGKYMVLGNSELTPEDKLVLDECYEILTALRMTDAVLDEKIKDEKEEVTLSYMIDLLIAENTELTGEHMKLN